MLRYLPFLLVLALWIYAFIDCLNTPESQVRGLPKVVWVIVILLFGEVLLGPIAWLVAGKARYPAQGGGSTPSEWHRNHGANARGTWVAPDDNPEFLRSLKEEPASSQSVKDEALLKDWEADLRRREEQLRRQQRNPRGAAGTEGAEGTTNGPQGKGGPEDTTPPAKD
ncbi:PLD nuclease N-terminal domain-containing protein [Streptomyces sp. YGL11-2]|uniref:PLD nuclease N-terminal domain-containing protein n=1 Tax=Streptomyces sp. YGL11-2 TaxID=3414028 RepID=UPI003CEB7F9B